MVYLIDYFFIFYLSSTLSYDSNIINLALIIRANYSNYLNIHSTLIQISLTAVFILFFYSNLIILNNSLLIDFINVIIQFELVKYLLLTALRYKEINKALFINYNSIYVYIGFRV